LNVDIDENVLFEIPDDHVAEEKTDCMKAVGLPVAMVDKFEIDVEGEGEADIAVILL
jgi:hypothetical protein